MQVYRLLGQLSKQSKSEAVAEEELAEVSGLSVKRVKVILALLDGLGIVEKKTQLKTVRDFADDDELELFLTEYEERHNDDRKRLEAMMLYRQTTTCRVRYISEYFRQEMEGDCGHCDNCRIQATAPARVE